MRTSGGDGERQAEEVGFLAFITPSTPKKPIRINITALFWNWAACEPGHCVWLSPEPSITDSRRRLQPQKSCRSICRDFPGFYWLIWPCGSPLRLLACRQRFAKGVRYWCRRLSNVRRQSQRSKNTQAIQSSSYGYNPHRFYRIQCAVFLTEMPPNLSVWWSVKPWKPSGTNGQATVQTAARRGGSAVTAVIDATTSDVVSEKLGKSDWSFFAFSLDGVHASCTIGTSVRS